MVFIVFIDIDAVNHLLTLGNQVISGLCIKPKNLFSHKDYSNTGRHLNNMSLGHT